MRQFRLKKSILIIGLSLYALSSQTFAAGFSINLDTAGDLGNANAGGAAIAQDASINAFNAAGLSYLHKQQLVFSGSGVFSHTNFTGSVSAPNELDSFLATFTATGKVKSNNNIFIPAFYYSRPLSDNWDFGVGVTQPFSMNFKYGEQSFLRYELIKDIQNSINVGPSLSYRFNSHFSVGAGPNFQYYSVETAYKINTAGSIPVVDDPFLPPVLVSYDSRSQISGHGWGYGGHAGIFYQNCDTTRVGLAYRSQLGANISGRSTFINGVNPVIFAAPPVTTYTNFRQKFILPANTILSAYQALSPKWAVLGTVDYTQWKSFNYIRRDNFAEVGLAFNVSIPEQFKNTWHFAGALNYQVLEHLLLRLGAGYDQLASNSKYRSVQYPNGHIVALAFGARFMATNTMGIDMGYQHSFIKSTSINLTSLDTFTNVKGKLHTYADVLGFQIVANL